MSVPAIQRHPEAPAPRLALVVPREELPRVSMRTCAACGEYTAFVREDNESWYFCAACGRYA
jgi:hypothetical protein